MANIIEEINPVLRYWDGHFKLSQSKHPVEELDVWVRRQNSLRHLATMEAALDEGAQPDALGPQGRPCLQLSVQWPRPLVELGSVTCEPGATEETVRSTRVGLDTGYDKPV